MLCIGDALYDGAVHHRTRYLVVQELSLMATRRLALAEALSEMLSTALDVTIGQHRTLGLDTTLAQVQTLITLHGRGRAGGSPRARP